MHHDARDMVRETINAWVKRRAESPHAATDPLRDLAIALYQSAPTPRDRERVVLWFRHADGIGFPVMRDH